jgi:hypothetical protein
MNFEELIMKFEKKPGRKATLTVNKLAKQIVQGDGEIDLPECKVRAVLRSAFVLMATKYPTKVPGVLHRYRRKEL